MKGHQKNIYNVNLEIFSILNHVAKVQNEIEVSYLYSEWSSWMYSLVIFGLPMGYFAVN